MLALRGIGCSRLLDRSSQLEILPSLIELYHPRCSKAIVASRNVIKAHVLIKQDDMSSKTTTIHYDLGKKSTYTVRTVETDSLRGFKGVLRDSRNLLEAVLGIITIRLLRINSIRLSSNMYLKRETHV